MSTKISMFPYSSESRPKGTSFFSLLVQYLWSNFLKLVQFEVMVLNFENHGGKKLIIRSTVSVTHERVSIFQLMIPFSVLEHPFFIQRNLFFLNLARLFSQAPGSNRFPSSLSTQS